MLPDSAADAEIAPDDQLGGRYRVGPAHAAGGLSIVYRGVDESTGEAVAIKVPRAEWARLPTTRARFEREVTLALRLGSSLGAAGRDSGLHRGRPFLVLDFIEGPTLRDRLMGDGPLPAPAALRMTARLLARLSTLHEEGLAHLDLKPAHILGSGDGLLDLGSALPVGARIEGAEGSPAYAAPEQWRPGAVADARSDLYSVGVILFEALCGQRPYRLDPAAPLSTWSQRQAPPRQLLPASCGPRLLSLVERALHPVPDERFASAAALLSAFSALPPEELGGP